MSEWQTMATAPKDGSAILLALHFSGDFVRYIGRWNADLMMWAENERGRSIFPDHMQKWFSHWAPLPAAPVKE